MNWIKWKNYDGGGGIIDLNYVAIVSKQVGNYSNSIGFTTKYGATVYWKTESLETKYTHEMFDAVQKLMENEIIEIS